MCSSACHLYALRLYMLCLIALLCSALLAFLRLAVAGTLLTVKVRLDGFMCGAFTFQEHSGTQIFVIMCKQFANESQPYDTREFDVIILGGPFVLSISRCILSIFVNKLSK